MLHMPYLKYFFPCECSGMEETKVGNKTAKQVQGLAKQKAPAHPDLCSKILSQNSRNKERKRKKERFVFQILV